MAQRILTLTGYLLRQFIFSLAGIIYILLALTFWRLFFDPGQQTPDPEYYVLVIGLFGAVASFLITFSIAARANLALNYPLLVRLPSRVEHLLAVLLSGLVFSIALQLVVALLATFNGPSLGAGRVLELPPIWLALNLLTAVLALHATDLVTAGWSRVYVYGFLAFLLFGRQVNAPLLDWLSKRLLTVASWFLREGYIAPGNAVSALSEWLVSSGTQLAGAFFDAVFWPFRAMSAAIVSGAFSPVQALAPAIIVLYAAVLFALAADFFATKDLYLVE